MTADCGLPGSPARNRGRPSGPGARASSIGNPGRTATVLTTYSASSDESPVVGVAVALTGSQARVAVTGATPWPRRILEAETTQPGRSVDDVGPDTRFRDDDVASAAYRAHLTRVLAARALARAGVRRA